MKCQRNITEVRLVLKLFFFGMESPRKGTEPYSKKLEHGKLRKQKQRAQAFLKTPFTLALVRRGRALPAKTRAEEKEKAEELRKRIVQRCEERLQKQRLADQKEAALDRQKRHKEAQKLKGKLLVTRALKIRSVAATITSTKSMTTSMTDDTEKILP